jgi:hypothetical protein
MRMASLRNGELEEQRKGVLSMSRPISERKLQANRANAKRSTGPRTEAGKAASRKNALKHGILSRSIDFPPAIDLDSLTLERSLHPTVSGADAALREISRIWGWQRSSRSKRRHPSFPSVSKAMPASFAGTSAC